MFRPALLFALLACAVASAQPPAKPDDKKDPQNKFEPRSSIDADGKERPVMELVMTRKADAPKPAK